MKFFVGIFVYILIVFVLEVFTADYIISFIPSVNEYKHFLTEIIYILLFIVGFVVGMIINKYFIIQYILRLKKNRK